MKLGIVIQGGLKSIYVVDKIIESYDSVKKDVVISTWSNEEYYLIDKLKSSEYEVILNDVPDYAGICNINLQTYSSSCGIDYFRNKKYTHILKIRTDMVPNDINVFIETLSSISLEKLIFLCWFDKYDIHYICDFFSFGPIDNSYKFWNVNCLNNEFFPEQFLTSEYIKLSNPKYDDIKDIFSFSIKELSKNNIMLIRTSTDTNGINFGLDQINAYLEITKDIYLNY